MTELDQIGRDIDATHVDTGSELVIYNEDNTNEHIQSNAYLPLTECE